MGAEQSEANEPTKSENEPEEQKSEEFLNFENAMKGIFSLSPAKAKAIRKIPAPDNEADEQEAS